YDEWIDPNDKSDDRLGENGKGRRHLDGWDGPEAGWTKRFQIVTKVDGKPQSVLVYLKDVLIDIIQDPMMYSTCKDQRKHEGRKHDREPIVGGFWGPSSRARANYCIWNCLAANNKAYAPLLLGNACELTYNTAY
ncbi:hypothetical protein PFISCL1PPCAC_23288, partial [Pristionchus fissidentatus]